MRFFQITLAALAAGLITACGGGDPLVEPEFSLTFGSLVDGMMPSGDPEDEEESEGEAEAEAEAESEGEAVDVGPPFCVTVNSDRVRTDEVCTLDDQRVVRFSQESAVQPVDGIQTESSLTLGPGLYDFNVRIFGGEEWANWSASPASGTVTIGNADQTRWITFFQRPKKQEPPSCDPWADDCDGDGMAPDLTVPDPPCDPWAEDCDGDGVSPDLTECDSSLPGPCCDPFIGDCDEDGTAPDLTVPDPPCDPWAEDCDGDGVSPDLILPECDGSWEDCDGNGVVDALEATLTVVVYAEAESDATLLGDVVVEIPLLGLSATTPAAGADLGRVSFTVEEGFEGDLEVYDPLAVYGSSSIPDLVVTDGLVQPVLMFPATGGIIGVGTGWEPVCVGCTQDPFWVYNADGSVAELFVEGIGPVAADDPRISCRSETPEFLAVALDGRHPCAYQGIAEGDGSVVVLFEDRESDPIAVPVTPAP